ncbi:MAG: ISAs1 family transposase [Limnoraphis sp. WC205]|jgi:predicted transposase YbfD/YdcC|nr:ISAs1 family transposase [Limnoraphis sp. WC205]
MDSLIEYLKLVKDFRRKQGQKYPLWWILLIVILGLMAGHLGYRALGGFAKSQQQTFTEFFKLRLKKAPSYSTIRRAIQGVDWAELIGVFNQWATQLEISNDEARWLAVDGKSLKSTLQYYCQNRQNFVSMVSVFCQENGLVLALGKFENKHCSEIHQVQEMVRALPLEKKVFTLDALHCQKQTVETITASGNDYLIAVKKNQKGLYKRLQLDAQTAVPLSTYQSQDNSHGRRITRQVSVFKTPHEVQSLWVNAQSFIQVQRCGTRGTKLYQETAYYISSRQENAQIFARAIQGHWRIENQLHWVKDVIFQEDKSLVFQFQPAINFSVLSTIALNLLRILGFVSVTEGRRWLSGNVWRLMILLA